MKEQWLPWSCLLVVSMLMLLPQTARGHGAVVLEDDQCFLRMGYLEAHFKIYLPERRGHEQFCEDLPVSGEAVFVMEYLHPSLSELPIEFRIIRNVTGLGRFTRWEDVQAIDDLDAVTVFHHPAAVVADVFTVLHRFEGRGEYVGVVRAWPPVGSRELYAVFPFSVGFRGFGFWPWVSLFVGFVLVNTWVVRRHLR